MGRTPHAAPAAASNAKNVIPAAALPASPVPEANGLPGQRGSPDVARRHAIEIAGSAAERAVNGDATLGAEDPALPSCPTT